VEEALLHDAGSDLGPDAAALEHFVIGSIPTHSHTRVTESRHGILRRSRKTKNGP
jgi:hypothetical protein